MESNNDDPVDKIIETIYNKYNGKYVKEAFKILNMLFNNIINNPDEDKFKIFKKTNGNIQLKVLIIKECRNLIDILGYEELDEERLVFKGDIKRLKYATYVLKKHMLKIDEILEEEKRKEEEKRQEEIKKQIDEANKLYLQQKLEKEKLLEQCKNDRKEMAQRPKPKDSIAKNMKYGAHEVKVEFKCSGGAGGG